MKGNTGLSVFRIFIVALPCLQDGPQRHKSAARSFKGQGERLRLMKPQRHKGAARTFKGRGNGYV